ncbi:MAG: AraC family transcriptional regulator [Alphaproteobacteria bacterium]|nr:MAG: AraC family transcriptional regulator [Alphaproteobacteria bacterium]
MPNCYDEMVEIIDRHAPRDITQSGECAIDGLYFGRSETPSQPIYQSQWPCIALVVRGQKGVSAGGGELLYGVGDYLVVSLDMPVASRVTMASPEQSYLGLGLAIDADRLKMVLTRVGLRSARAPAQLGSLSVNNAEGSLIDAMLRLLRLLDTPEDIRALAPLAEEEILYRVLQGPVGYRLLDIAIAETPANRISKAIAWLKQNYTQSIRMEELARHAGMSVSSLHHSFKALTEMTPLQYQKQLRLQEARRLMLMDRLDVGSAAFRVGYQSPSQFSREYSRYFGISPARDVDRTFSVSAAVVG